MVFFSIKFAILLDYWKLGHLKLLHFTVLTIHAWESMIMEFIQFHGQFNYIFL
jgi:hypothetical protein